jgi:hypothetical protein
VRKYPPWKSLIDFYTVNRPKLSLESLAESNPFHNRFDIARYLNGFCYGFIAVMLSVPPKPGGSLFVGYIPGAQSIKPRPQSGSYSHFFGVRFGWDYLTNTIKASKILEN